MTKLFRIIAAYFIVAIAPALAQQGLFQWGMDKTGTNRVVSLQQSGTAVPIGSVNTTSGAFWPTLGSNQLSAYTGTGSTAVLSAAPTFTGNVSQTNNANTFFYQSAYGTAVAPSFTFVRGRGTAASPTDVQNGDLLGILDFLDQRANEGAKIFVQSSENHSSSAAGAQMYFYTRQNGASSPSLAMTIGSNQTIYGSADFNVINATNSFNGPSFRLGGDPIGNLVLGSTAAASGNAYLDFHSQGNTQPDVRLQVSGGFPSLFGGGLLTTYGSFEVNPSGADGSVRFSGIQQGLLVQQYPGFSDQSGASAGPSLNLISVGNDNIKAGSGFVNGLTVNHYFGGTQANGGRQTFAAYTILYSPTNAGNPNRNYVAVTGDAIAQSNDGGTGLTSSTSAGQMFGAGFVAQLNNGATNMNNMTATEFNTAAQTGSSVWAKSIIQLSGRTDDKVAGSNVNAMIWLYNQAGAVSWSDGILFDNGGGIGPYALSSSGNVLRVSGGTYANGINLAGTITGYAFISNNFSVSGAGLVAAAQYSTATGIGVDCSGTPSAAFFVSKGIVTHC